MRPEFDAKCHQHFGHHFDGDEFALLLEPFDPGLHRSLPSKFLMPILCGVVGLCLRTAFVALDFEPLLIPLPHPFADLRNRVRATGQLARTALREPFLEADDRAFADLQADLISGLS